MVEVQLKHNRKAKWKGFRFSENCCNKASHLASALASPVAAESMSDSPLADAAKFRVRAARRPARRLKHKKMWVAESEQWCGHTPASASRALSDSDASAIDGALRSSCSQIASKLSSSEVSELATQRRTSAKLLEASAGDTREESAR
jgi:hypothetical protein